MLQDQRVFEKRAQPLAPRDRPQPQLVAFHRARAEARLLLVGHLHRPPFPDEAPCYALNENFAELNEAMSGVPAPTPSRLKPPRLRLERVPSPRRTPRQHKARSRA